MAPDNKDGQEPGTDAPPALPGEPTTESGPPKGVVDPDPTTEDPTPPEMPAMPALEPEPAQAAVPPAPAAPVGPVASAVEDAHAGLTDEDETSLNSVGMFIEGDGDKVDIDSLELPPELAEPSFAMLRRNAISWVIFFAVILCSVGGAAYINSKAHLRIQLEYLFKGGLERHKKAELISKRERYAKEDHYAQNRYGEFKMIYSPKTAKVDVYQIKYKETITQFMNRFVRGMKDNRVKVGERKLEKFSKLTDNLAKNVIVTEAIVKDLPITSRSNPKDKDHPERVKACTDDTEDYCTFVYRVKISKEMYYPRSFMIFSDYSQDADPESLKLEDATKQKDWDKAQTLYFKQVGPTIFEVVWPGANLRAKPELFAEQFIRVMTDTVKCQLGPKDYEAMKNEKAEPIKDFAGLWDMAEDDRWQQMYDTGKLQHGPPNSQAWAPLSWRSSVQELKEERPELWLEVEERVKNCECKNDEEGRRIRCWKGEGSEPGPPKAPDGATPPTESK